MCVGAKILEFLNESGITQTFLSKKANIPLSKLNLALNGKRRITMEEYANICWALGVNTDQFISPKDPREKIA